MFLLPRPATSALTTPVPAQEDDWGTLVAVVAQRGSTARLPCHITSATPGEDVLLVLWYKNASVTPVYSYDSREPIARAGEARGRPRQWGDEGAWGEEQRAWFDTSSSPAHLLVRNTTGRDEGNYRCKVHFKGSPSWSQRITLNVQDPPGFPRLQDESGRRLEGAIGPYEDGTVVRMLCRSSGDPPPRLVWGGSGAGRRGDLRSEGSTVTTQLNLEASRSTADTTVTCSSINTTTNAVAYTVSTTLRVNLPPLKVTLESPGAWVSAGQQTTFRCRVEGSSPEPVVQWWLGGRQLTPSTPPRVVEEKVSVSTVRLTPEPGDHGAPLMCKAFSPNLAGTVLHDQLTLAVHFLPVAVSKVEGGGTQANVREGGVVTFTCSVTANPKVYSVAWYHNGRRLQVHTRAAMVTNSTLTLKNVTARMRGLYTCVGSNREGDGQSNALNLNVEFVPMCRPGRLRDFVVGPDGSVNLECGVEAHPAALTYSWAIENEAEASTLQSLPSTGRVEGLTGHYRLSRVGRRLNVLCWAKNTVGAQTKPCKITVHTQGRPQPVKSCKVGNNTAAGFAVLCQPSGPSSGDTRYSLLVYAQNNPRGSDDGQGGASERNEVMWPSGGEEEDPEHPVGDLLLNLTSTSPEFEVGGLQAGHEFTVLVSATNAEGTSPPAELSAFTLRDNKAQTVIGVPSGAGRGGSSSSGSSSGGSSSGGGSGSSSSSSSGNGGGKSDAGKDGGDGEGNEGVVSGWVWVPPMMVVLVASLAAILMLAVFVIVVIKRRGRRVRREQRTLGQAKLQSEVMTVAASGQDLPTPSRPSSSSPGTTRKESDRGETTDCSGSSVGGGSGRPVIQAGGVVVSVAPPLDRGSCNGGYLSPAAPASPQASILSAPCQEASSSTCSTLPLLGVRQLGHGLSRQTLLPHEIPVVGALGLEGVGGIPRTSLGVSSLSTFTLAPGGSMDAPSGLRMGCPSMGSLVGVGAGVGMGVRTFRGSSDMGGGTLPRAGAHNIPPAQFPAHYYALPLHHLRPAQDFLGRGPAAAATTTSTVTATVSAAAATTAVSVPSSENVSAL